MKGILLAASAASLTAPAMAQDIFYWPAPAAVTGPVTKNYFPMGTPVVLRTRTEINTKQAKPGDRVYLEVAESITYQGQIVVPIGAPAVAEVVRSERNGHFGKKGKLDVRLLYVQTPHGPIRLTGQTSDEGKSGTAASVATILLVSPLGFLIHGTSARLPHGSVVNGYLAEPLEFVSQPMAPLVAQASVDPNRPLPARFDPSVFGGKDIPGGRR